MRGPLSCAVLGVLLLSAALASAADTSAPLDDARYFLLVRRSAAEGQKEDARVFADSAVRAVSGALRDRGLRREEKANAAEFGEAASLAEPALVRSVGAEAGVRWVIVVGIDLQPRRLSWRMAAYDAQSGALLASDAFSAFPGLSALPLIDNSAVELSRRWHLAATEDEPRREGVPISQRFLSKDDGVSLRYGSAPGPFLEAGTTAGGTLEAAYVPFFSGEPVHVELYRDGYWPKSMVLPSGVTEEPVRLPRLQRRAGQAWGPSIGVGRFFGAGASYRLQPLPDRLYLRAENAFWINSDFMPGSSPVLHNELRLGAAAYLQRNRDARLRISAGLGASGIGTFLTDAQGYDSASFLDFVLEPLFVSFEYHAPAWALVLEQRVPYALGTGILPQGWMELGNAGPMFLSLGVLFKW